MLIGATFIRGDEPVYVTIDTAGCAVDAFITEAFTEDGHLDDEEIQQLEEEYAGDIQELAYIEEMENNLRYERR